MKNIGIWANVEKKGVLELLVDIIRWLEAKECNVLLDREVAVALDKKPHNSNFPELIQQADMLLVLGGDGTILNCARVSAPYNIPLFGINMGRLGFLTETELPELFVSLDKLLLGNFRVEERMMLQARVIRGEENIEETIALNDVVITKGGFARIIMLETMVDEQFFTTYPADGIIVASPTGSTAYSLSAGGPLAVPNLELMIITPICPHGLWARPLVISSSSEVKVNLLSDQGEVMLTVDGQYGLKLKQGDSVVISRAPYRAKFLKLADRNFFGILRQKLKQGDRNV
ncbi:MAG: NAD(+) kinase [Firmicutes bacterium]|nr:NAD(+) kinase [Bacillota bacterium]